MAENKTLQLQDLVLAAQGIPPLPEAKQYVWNLLGQAKVAMDTAIQKCALEIQPHLASFETMDQPALVKGIAAYKEVHGRMVQVRQSYTSYLDTAKDMCMGTERVWDPKTNATFAAATARELKLRGDAHKTATDATAKATEEQMFRTFCINEFHDMVAGFRLGLSAVIQQAYTACLTQRIPVENIAPAITACNAAMREVKPRLMGKFDKKIITDQEAMKIFEAVLKPNWQGVFNEAIESLKTKFNLYGNDLANPDAALVKQTEMFTQEQTQVTNQAQAEQAANTLLAQGTVTISTPVGMKPITEVSCMDIPTVIDWAWECTIIAAFLAHANVCKDKVRTTKGGALTTSQMAKALDACGIKVEGAAYTAIRK